MYNKYLQENNFENYFAKLINKLKGKKILIYGAGQIFKFIKKNYDLSELNVVGICDRQFLKSQEGEDFFGYRIIHVENINNYDYDCVLISVLKYYSLGFQLRSLIKNKSIKFYPLVRQKFINNLKDLFKQKPKLTQIPKIIGSYFAFENEDFCKYYDKNLIKMQINSYNKIKNNYIKVLKKIRKKAKKQKIRVGFLCCDSARWKCQILYDLLEQDKHFEPVILMARRYLSDPNHTSLQSIQDFEEKCNYFKERGMRVEIIYDSKRDKYSKINKYNIDYLFYQLPFYNHEIYHPQTVSKTALTGYIPYYVPTSIYEEWALDFRAILHKQFLIDENIKKYYEDKMPINTKNIEVVGHPTLDFFLLNKENNTNREKLRVIYAPHHSLKPESCLNLSTFLDNGNFILNYAKSHPEIEWIFRPHPLLKNVLKTIWGSEKTDQYYDAWESIGKLDGEGDYMQTFLNSDLLINECSFIVEYFYSKHPAIHLQNINAAPYDETSERIISSNYVSYNNEELKNYLDLLLVEKKDPKYGERIELLEELNSKSGFASENILNNLKRELEII